MKSYRVTYERDQSGWWVAAVRGARGCHARGRTVDEARRRFREALELGAIATVGDPLGRRGAWLAGGDFTYATSNQLLAKLQYAWRM